MSIQSNNTEEYRDIDSRIILNVGGIKFETRISTFSSYPNSLLGTMFSIRNEYLLKKDFNGEVFFDRNPNAFEAILHLYFFINLLYSYRTGNLYCPYNISKEILKDELDYFSVLFNINRYQFHQIHIYIYGVKVNMAN